MSTPTDPRSRSLSVATGAVLLGLLGLGVAVALSRVPADPSADGFAAGLSAAFGPAARGFTGPDVRGLPPIGVALSVTSLLALCEATVLAAGEHLSTPAPGTRLLLATGAAAGGLAALPTVALELAWGAAPGATAGTLVVRLVGPLVAAWLLLAALGATCSALGVAVHVAGAFGGEPAEG